jgi:hypothetical protein
MGASVTLNEARSDRDMVGSDRLYAAWVVGLTLAGGVARAIYVGWVHPLGSALYSDMFRYYSTAKVFADPYHVMNRWDVVWPRALGLLGGLVLRHAGAQALTVLGVFQSMLGTCVIPLTAMGTRRLFGRRAAILACVLIALDPIAIGFTGLFMAETYVMVCLSVAFACLIPERPVACAVSGIALGVGALCKPQVLPLGVLWVVVIVLWSPALNGTRCQLGRATRWVAAAALFVGMAIPLVPETVAVSKIVGRPTFISAYSGQNFYVGHCPVRFLNLDFGTGGEVGGAIPKVVQRDEPWPDVTFHVSIMESAFLIGEGMKCVRRSWSRTSLWAVQQLADVFAGWPGATIDVWPVGRGWLSIARGFNLALEYCFAPAGIWWLWKRRREEAVWLGFGAPLGAVWGLALLFSGDPRYREPFDIFVISGGGRGLLAIGDGISEAVRVLRERRQMVVPGMRGAHMKDGDDSRGV